MPTTRAQKLAAVKSAVPQHSASSTGGPGAADAPGSSSVVPAPAVGSTPASRSMAPAPVAGSAPGSSIIVPAPGAGGTLGGSGTGLTHGVHGTSAGSGNAPSPYRPANTDTSPRAGSMVSLSTVPKSARSSRSSDTLKVEILAAKAEHARRLAARDAERDRIQTARDAERDRAVAELELQAELAAIEANASRHLSGGSSHRSRGSSRHTRGPPRGPQSLVEDWLSNPDNITITCPKEQNKTRSFVGREEDKPLPPNAAHSQALSLAALGTVAEKNVLLAPDEAPPQSMLPAAPGTAPMNVRAATSHHLPARELPTGPPTDLELAGCTLHAPGLGTHTNQTYCNCYINKNNDSVGTPFIQLANAITNLSKKPSKVCDIYKFDGRAADWLLFKKSYDQSKVHFSPSDNIARLSAALHGAAREAVSIRLVAADDPDNIVQALEMRFAQPEVIVLHQLSLVRALPRIGAHEAPRDMNVFACRVRNCVEVVRLLNQPEYLASPELVNSIIGKLNPLLRSRWADFASTRIGSGKFKLEILADFLESESILQTKFGVILPESTLVKCQSLPVKSQRDFTNNKEKIFPYAVSTNSSVKTGLNTELCKCCSLVSHELNDCEKFRSLSLDDRWRLVVDNKVCRKCLIKGSHQYRNCKKRCKVGGCKRNWHHTLLHKPDDESTAHVTDDRQPSDESVRSAPSTDFSMPCQSAVVAHSAAVADHAKPLLKVVPVTITGKKGSIHTYALLDDGSSATLVDESVADLLVDGEPKTPLQINCIGGLTKLTEVRYIDISVSGRHCSSKYHIKARSIPNLGLRAQSIGMQDVRRYKHLSDLAEVLVYDDAKPTCLIGTDNWHLLLPQTIRRCGISEPAAVQTPLGWALFGYIKGKVNPVEFVNHVEVDNLDQNLDSIIKSYYKLDSIGISKEPYLSPSDKRALDILEQSTVRLPSGRFETGLLWRNDIHSVPDSKGLALSRFYSLEKKMARDDDYATQYKQNIHAMLEKGYAELCVNPPSGKINWYLPHFGVVHAHKKKLRLVHDAAARCHGVSLNSMLLSGPDLLQPLLAIVMRFRERQVALTGDIREMFPQVKIRPEDRDAQRFLWRDSPQEPLREYRMSSMIFGATSSPCTALFLKNKNATEFQQQYPEAARSIIEDHYMDDYLGSVDGVEEAARLVSEIVSIHKAAGFEMRAWVSSHPDALAFLPAELHATDAVERGLGPSSPSETRILGLTWQVIKDSLCFLKSIPSLPQTFTKRSTLSLLMSVFDPLGFITPLIIKGRIIFQKTWKLGIDWGHCLPESVIDAWKSWFHELECLSGCSIPRCYSGLIAVVDAQLHVFADASELAYACVAYWRLTLADGSVKLALIGGKARLASLKPTTIPRLELQAALIAARFAVYIENAHRKKPSKIVMWSDSVTVLKWLRSDACTFKQFVAFRIAEISEITDVQSWRYVPTSMNVADDATRDSGQLTKDSRWFTGPSFLISPSDVWPSEPISNVPVITTENKVISETVSVVVEGRSDQPPTILPIVAEYQRFSRWLRLLRATARAHQAAKVFISLLPRDSNGFQDSVRCSRNLPVLSVDNLNSAELHLFKRIQRDSFADELACLGAGHPVSSQSRLRNLSLVIAEDGLLRLSGRTTACNAVDSFPIILDGKHQITRLLIGSYHTRFAHGNNESVVNELRQRFHVLGLRPAVKHVASKCHACRIRKAQPIPTPVGDLPHARTAHHERPFTYCGLDYFGPVNVTIGRRTAKRWVALFTCLTIRAVHMEIVGSLSSDSAIMALRRFVARRGSPACIYSDNGTAFVGAAKLLPDLYEFAAAKEIRWKFIAPSAPFMGGCWERLIRNVKSALSVTLQERTPREEILLTLLSEAEAIVNSRPLTHVAIGHDEETALTPFTFLIGTSSNDIQTRQFDDHDLSSRAQWRKSQRLADHFWERFVAEYLPTLVPRKCSPRKTRQLQIGDLVCVADGTLPRRCWPMGRIVATYPGKDGIVRVADVSTKGGVLRRHARKLALLVTT